MSYQREREFFLVTFAREFPGQGMAIARTLLREATSEQRYNEIACSIELTERETAQLERKAERRLQRVRAIAKALGVKLIENGDPRGFPYLLTTPSGRTYDFGGRGLGIPGRGLPARCFA